MEIPTALISGAVALAILAMVYMGIWHWVRTGLSMDYDEVETWTIPRSFPGRRAFWFAKLLIALPFVTLFVVTKDVGAEPNSEVALLALALLALFVIASFWEGIRAFRHYAVNHLPPVDRDGYIKR